MTVSSSTCSCSTACLVRQNLGPMGLVHALKLLLCVWCMLVSSASTTGAQTPCLHLSQARITAHCIASHRMEPGMSMRWVHLMPVFLSSSMHDKLFGDYLVIRTGDTIHIIRTLPFRENSQRRLIGMCCSCKRAWQGSCGRRLPKQQRRALMCVHENRRRSPYRYACTHLTPAISFGIPLHVVHLQKFGQGQEV